MRINSHYSELKESYLFSDINHKVATFRASHPDPDVIRMGIGDVTLPLCQAAVDAMKEAVDEMGRAETFRGYGPEQGYDFLRDAIVSYYTKKGVALERDEIFVSDGAKSDLGNILDLFDPQNTVLIPDPVYPVYVDTNLMAGRRIQFLKATVENQFLPMPPAGVKADIIYLCSPNNPTGAVYNRDQLAQWVAYANDQEAILLFDSAYEAFIQDPSLPRSIYEIPGAKTCAIEFCSFSKTAGFTGTRCGYTVVPKDLTRGEMSLNRMWLRRQTTKFNGVPYIVQRGAAAVLTEEGIRQAQQNIAYYMGNAAVIANALRSLGIWFAGGENSPYIWMQCPKGYDSWQLFDLLLEKAHVVGTPGAGFGSCGEGFFRLTAFGRREDAKRAMERLCGVYPR